MSIKSTIGQDSLWIFPIRLYPISDCSALSSVETASNRTSRLPKSDKSSSTPASDPPDRRVRGKDTPPFGPLSRGEWHAADHDRKARPKTSPNNNKDCGYGTTGTREMAMVAVT